MGVERKRALFLNKRPPPQKEGRRVGKGEARASREERNLIWRNTKKPPPPPASKEGGRRRERVH